MSPPQRGLPDPSALSGSFVSITALSLVPWIELITIYYDSGLCICCLSLVSLLQVECRCHEEGLFLSQLPWLSNPQISIWVPADSEDVCVSWQHLIPGGVSTNTIHHFLLWGTQVIFCLKSKHHMELAVAIQHMNRLYLMS